MFDPKRREAGFKLIRDPLYDYITISPRERDLVDSLLVQRLRGIKQLQFAYLVYPSAQHTRFEHSLGVMHLAGEVARCIGLDQPAVERARIAGLLHDVGHGPYSHLFESFLAKVSPKTPNHEAIGQLLLERDEEIQGALKADFDDVMETLRRRGDVVKEVISSGLDADKLDYLRRDSHHLGVAYGMFDLPRILTSLRCEGNRLKADFRGTHAVDGFRHARFQMYTQVYNQHAKEIADRMFVRAAEIAVEDGDLPSRLFDFDGDREGFLSRYRSWDDASFMDLVSASARGEAKELVERVRRRRLFKRACYREFRFLPPVAGGQMMGEDFEWEETERYLSESSGAPRRFVFACRLHINTKQYDGLSGSEPILLKNQQGDTEEISNSQVVSAPRTPVMQLLVFGPEEFRDRLATSTESYVAEIDVG